MYAVLARFGLGDPHWLDPVATFVAVLVTVVVAGAFNKLLFPLVLRLTRLTPSDLDTRMLHATRRPITLGIILLGVYLTLTLILGLTVGVQQRVDQVIGLLGIILGVITVVALFSTVLDWYLENLSSQTQHVIDLKLFPLLRRIATVLIYGLGGLLILDLLDINISPLIAGLGLGGLAVALALQPTLANLFAGTYVMTEGAIAPGDYIEMEGGAAGWVVEVGWRSTRIRTWRNNLVVVPNNRFAETIITNYQQPAPMVNVWVQCGVSYDSDLYHVENVSREVMDEIIDTEPEAIKDYGGFFGYDSFDASNVSFWLFVQAKDRWGSFAVQTALMKRLHARFKEENITINYPMRSLEFPKEWSPETMRLGSQRQQGKRLNSQNYRPRTIRRKLPKNLQVTKTSDNDDGDTSGSPASS